MCCGVRVCAPSSTIQHCSNARTTTHAPTTPGVGSLVGAVLDATPASRHPASSFYAMTTFPVVVVALTTVVAFTSLGLFDPLVFPHLQRALGACDEIKKM